MCSHSRVLSGRAARALFASLSVFVLAAVARATIGAALQAQLGKPTAATVDPTNHAHYLIERDQYAMDYNDTTRVPNWVSWDLTSGDVGGSGRSNFAQDTNLPSGFYQVLTTDYSGSGYDRGHMCPSADRTVTVADNQQVFYMSNMAPQTPDNNQGIWASFETYCRTLASAGNEILIVCGPSGYSGSTIASGVAIPGYTWKIAVVVPLGSGTALSRVTASTRVIAIKVPNISGVRSTPWSSFVTSVAQIEADTGDTFFGNLPAGVAATLRTVVDGQTVTGAPAIVAQPTAQTSAVGGSASFTVSATGDAPLSYQWAKDTVDLSGATDATLTLSNIQATDAGSYTVTVSNAVGSVTSSEAALVISGLPPSIASEPTSRTVAAGTTVSFTVTASGSPTFTYEWRKDGVTVSNSSTISGATTPTLTLGNVQASDMGTYDVVVTNSVTFATSTGATLTVTPSSPTITSQPASRSLAPGSTATFEVIATGTAPLTYQWRKGGAAIVGNTSATTATLTLTGISAADAGDYDVVVTNTVGSTTSSVASLAITSASATQIFYTGGTYTQDFNTLPSSGTYTQTGVGPYYLSSSPYNGTNLGGWSFGKIGGSGTVATFAVGTGSGNSGATYSFGASGSSERALGALLSGTVASTWGATLVNNTGQTITQFTLSYYGEQWRYGGGTLGGTDRIYVEYGVGATDVLTGTFTTLSSLDFTSPINSATAVGTAGAKDGNTNRALRTATVSGVTWAPGQTLVVRWRDADVGGSDDGLAIDDVSFSTPISGPVGPSVASTTPANHAAAQALNAAITVTFDQAVTASGSAFVINSASRGVVSASASASADGKTYTLTPPGNFDFSDTVSVSVLAAGIVSQSTGLHPAADYAFSFTTASAVAPTITTDPVTQSAAAGSTVTFTVAASGTAPFTYQWRKNGAAMFGNATAATASLVLTNVQADDAASYDVLVSNGVNPSATSAAATLTVNAAAPTVVTAPAAQTVTEGDTVVFKVVATGTTPFAYQWQRNGVALADTATITGSNTATLTLTTVTPSQAGTYTVIVSNGVGSPVTTTGALLTVNRLPQPFTAGNVVVVRVGTGSGSLVNTGNPVYLDEYTAAGSLVQSIALPATASGSNKPFVLGGTSTTEGALARSADRHFLTLAGYATTGGGSSSLSGTTVSSINRAVARIGLGGTVDTSTVLTDWSSGSSPRAAVTSDGTTFWIAGGAGGVRLTSLGTTTSASISTTIDNLRVVDIADGQLYISTQSGSAVRIGTVGTGLPTTSGQVVTALPGFPTSGSINGFCFLDLDPTVPGVDTLYATDDSTTGGILKYSLVSGTWTSNGTIVASGVRFVTGSVQNGAVSLFATTGGSSATGGGTLYSYTDATGYNGGVSGTATALATAATNTAFRGVAFAPGNAPAITAGPAAQTATVGETVTFSVTTTGSAPLSYQWRKDGVLLTNGGEISGADTAVLTLTGVHTADVGAYDVVVTNPIGSTTSATAALTVNEATATLTLSGLTATYDGTAHAATATTTPAALTVVFTYDGGSVAPTNAGSYAVVATITDVDYVGTATGTLVISPAVAAVTFGNLSATYTGSPISATVTTTPAGLAVALTYNDSPTAPTNAGSYTVAATVTDPNYVGSATGTFVIGKANATVTLGNLAATYTGSAIAATVTTAPAGLNTIVTYNGSTTPPTNAGSYAVAASVNEANYAGSASGTLVIGKASATVTLGHLAATYTGSAIAATVTTAPAGLNTVVTYNGSTTAPTNAGSYAVAASVSDTNYTGAASGTLVIAPASAIVTLSATQRTYDGTAKPVVVTTAPSGLAVVVTYNGGTAVPVNVGQYSVFAKVSDPNYSGYATGTLTIAAVNATVTLGNLRQAYDGTPKSVTVVTNPANLPFTVTYNGSATAPTNPGTYTVVATINDPNYSGTLTGQLVITITSLVRHGVTLDGSIDGSLQILTGESVIFNGSAWVSGDLLVPGTPSVTYNKNAVYGGTLDGTSATTPTNYSVTLNGKSVLRHVVRRTNAISLPTVAAPSTPTGTRWVTINSGGTMGSFAGVNGLTLNGNVGQVTVPAGVYGYFTANGGSGFTLGVEGATVPSVYQFQGLTLNGNSQVKIVGPVIITVAWDVNFNAVVGNADHPEWLTFNVASGGATLNGSAIFRGSLVAPNGTIIVNGKLLGTTASDRLIVNGNGAVDEP